MVYCEGVEVESKLGKLIQAFRCDRPDEWTMDEFIRQAEDMHAEITRLRETEKDAARYRWLRDNCTTTQADCLGPIFVMTVRRKEHLFNVGLSIDQAMKEKGDE